MEFYLDENGNKTHKVNKEGKERRSHAKIILLGICYGKTMKSIAEDLGVSEEKATEIYNAVLTNISGLKHFMEESQEMARQLGYVEDKWGRRRYLPDMQLQPYELECNNCMSFDPFFDSEELGIVDDTERLKRSYIEQLQNCKYNKQKQKIKDKAKQDGFEVKENTRKIEDATRQCVNARVQGSAATQSKIAMRLIGTNPQLKKLGFKTELLVHDEVIGEVPFITAAKAVPLFQQCMLDSAKEVRSGAAVDVEVTLVWYGESIDKQDLNKEKLQEFKKDTL